MWLLLKHARILNQELLWLEWSFSDHIFSTSEKPCVLQFSIIAEFIFFVFLCYRCDNSHLGFLLIDKIHILFSCIPETILQPSFDLKVALFSVFSSFTNFGCILSRSQKNVVIGAAFSIQRILLFIKIV